MASLRRYFLASAFFAAVLSPGMAYSLCEAGSPPQCIALSSANDMEQVLAGVSCLRAHYAEERVIANVKGQITFSGMIIVARGVGVILQQTLPIAKETIIASRGVFEDRERIAVFPEAIQQTLIALFSMQLEELQSDFSSSFKREGTAYTINLLPLSSGFKRNIQNVVLSGSCYPDRLSISQTNGEARTYALSDLSFGPFTLTDQEQGAFKLAALQPR